MRVFRVPRSIFLALLLPSAHAAAQARADTVRGRVTDDRGAPLPDASVVVTRLSDRDSRTASADAAGRWALVWSDGDGDYLVHVGAPGRAPVTRRVSRAADRSLGSLVVDVTLTAPSAQQLAAIVTRAARAAPRPDRAAPNAAPGVGASEGTAVPQNAAQRLGPSVAGDLSALAAMTPGVTQVAGGISVFGLGAGQNSVTLNGMAFPATDIPRDARAVVRVSASTYDPANGWFSGARTNVQLAPGGLFSSRTAHVMGDAPALQYGDPVSAQLGQRFTNVSASAGGDGQLVRDRYAYNVAVQGARRSASVASLLSASADLLQHAGLAPDSAARAVALLGPSGIPAGVASAVVTEDVSLIGRVDRAPYDWSTLTPARTTANVTGYARLARAGAQGLAPTGTPSHAGTSAQTTAALQGDYSFYLRDRWLADVRSGVTLDRRTSDPSALLPEARARVTSALADGTSAVSTLQLGGNSALGGTSRAWTWESLGELQLYADPRAAHRVKLAADARLDRYTQDPATNRLGTFSYNSLADLAANRPASFTRTLASPVRTGGAWNGALSLGDLWRASPSLQLVYGARVEGNAFVGVPAYNPAVAAAFGARTDEAPNGVHVSPRLGFTLNHPAGGRLPPGTLRGGVGEFRNLLDPALLAAPSAATGLPGGLTQLACIGGAVPTPQWSAYAADASTIPAQCLGGLSTFADATPAVRLVDPAFGPARSWRGNLAWASSWHGHVYSVEGFLSDNLSQPGTRDLNFSGTPRFATSDEGRPVFAAPTSVVPSSGLVSAADARRSAAFGRVVESVSDLRSLSRQLTLTLRPNLDKATRRKAGDFAFGYTLSSVRARRRGFDAGTFGDPNAVEWARADLDARHQFVMQGILRPVPGIFLFLYGHLQSGTPFTPLVATDVNGDGLANDRAFVADPTRTSDASLGAGIRTLLASSTPAVRDCLERQLGRAASRGSCEGPWTASLNTNLRVDGGRFHAPRATLFVDLQNPLGGIDQLVHGSANLRGWGTPAAPDPILYTVRGFDPAANRFRYDVNPRFGSARARSGTVRAPFRLTLDLQLDIGRPLAEQQLDRWIGGGTGARRDGDRPNVAGLVMRLRRNVPDPYDALLLQADSLLLSPAQVVALEAAQRRLRARTDSAWTTLAAYLAALPERYDAAAASQRTDKAIDDVWELVRQDVRTSLGPALEPAQRAALSGWAGQLWRAAGRVHLRIYTG